MTTHASSGLILVVLIVYVVGMYVLGFVAQRRVHDADDYLVAGRRLGVPFATATILATWFGAGTLLTATEEIRNEGVQRAALDPFGAGICLIIAGLVFAVPLREMKLHTLADLFARKFGRKAEVVSALLMVPAYFGWLAAQFVALASVLELFFGVPVAVGIVVVAVIGLGYTWLGGMWSVTLTDAVQMALVILGLFVLVPTVLSKLGDGSTIEGLLRIGRETPPERLSLYPLGSGKEVMQWVGVLAVGALGNLPGQDLFQRVFSARTPEVARRACILSGVLYLGLGMLVVVLGLASRLVMTDADEGAIIVALAHLFFTPTLAVIFTVAVVSAVLSTIDSATLSPAAVLAENVLVKVMKGSTALARVRICVVLVTIASVVTAWMGENAYALLEEAYSMPLAGLLVPLTAGVFLTPRREASALYAMGVGTALWLFHLVMGWEGFLSPLLGDYAPPVALTAAVFSGLAYAMSEKMASPSTTAS